MAEFPALPLWTDAYLGDTTHLSTIEHGAYLLLLMTAWRTNGCSLPDDDRLLARYARLSGQQWKRMRPVIEDFFVVRSGRWRQPRLTDERDTVKRFSESQSRKGKRGADARALKRKDLDAAGAEPGLLPVSTERQPDLASQSQSQDSIDKSMGAEAPQMDPVKELFDLGVALLVEAGRGKREARSLIGKWRKAKGGNGAADALVLAALLDCRARSISDPVAWLEQRIAGGGRWVSSSGYEYRGDDEAVLRESERRADWETHWAVKAALSKREKVS
jgi:uncharacterized protein YdaU (DUF1376 family)